MFSVVLLEGPDSRKLHRAHSWCLQSLPAAYPPSLQGVPYSKVKGSR